MLALNWTFPPDLPELSHADKTTQVTVLFDKLGDSSVRIRLHVNDWGEGATRERAR